MDTDPPVPYTIPPQAKRPRAKQIIKEVLAKYDVPIWMVYNNPKMRPPLAKQAVQEICGRLFVELGYSMAVISQCTACTDASTRRQVREYVNAHGDPQTHAQPARRLEQVAEAARKARKATGAALPHGDGQANE